MKRIELKKQYYLKANLYTCIHIYNNNNIITNMIYMYTYITNANVLQV